MEIHEDLISSCSDRLRAAYDTLRAHMIQHHSDHGVSNPLGSDKDFTNRAKLETTRMCRLLKLLLDYVSEYDYEFQLREERTLLPLGRAHRFAHET